MKGLECVWEELSFLGSDPNQGIIIFIIYFADLIEMSLMDLFLI